MKKIEGTYATAIVYTDLIEDAAARQIQTLCSQPFAAGSRIRIMPDVHAGTGCVIGFTADLGELVIPSIVGVDIGCGMLTVELGKEPVDFSELDRVIRQYVPSGMEVHPAPAAEFPELEALHAYGKLRNLPRILSSIGTLGGGNHFIEVDVDDDGMHYLVIHTGSRNLGKQVAEYYQTLAFRTIRGGFSSDDQSEIIRPVSERRAELIARYKAEGRTHELAAALEALNRERRQVDIPRELCYLTGENRQAYLHDMRICQVYAAKNRQVIAERILTRLTGRPLDAYPFFETIHNYIDHDTGVIRKGAVSAKQGELLLIPINMRDGSLICVGKGNPEWNCSAPHGAGRLLSRSAARKAFTLEAFAQEMEGIFTTSVGTDTLDECPMAYKPMESILANIGPTVEIQKIIRPVYNFKAGEMPES